MTNVIYCFIFYFSAMLIFPWLFLREKCEYPWSRIRKVLFALLLCIMQLVMVLGFVEGAAVEVNMKARGRLQGIVSYAGKALGGEDLSAQEICAGLREKYYREADPAQWNALKKTVLVFSGLEIAGLLLLAGILFASVRFKLRTLPFLLLFYGCAAGCFVAGSRLYVSVSDLMGYGFERTAFREVNLAVMAKIMKSEDRVALRYALEDVHDAGVWDGKEMDDFTSCITMCEDFLSVLYESQRKYESKREEAKTETPPETLERSSAE